MSVALASRTNGHIGNGIEVRLQHRGIAKHLVAEGVEAVEHNANVGGRNPALQFSAVVKVDGTRTALERREGHVSVAQRRNVTVLAGAECARFGFASFQWQVVRLRVGFAASGTKRIPVGVSYTNMYVILNTNL